jgi:hypothetical protein
MHLLCGTCKKVVEKAIGAMPDDLACTAAAAGIVAAIELAGEGPEDPVADALAIVAAAVIEELCLKHGWPWIKSHSNDVAEVMCKAAELC